MKLIKSKDLFDKIMSDLSTHEQFADFNFKAGSNRIILRSKGFKKEVKILRYIDRHDSEMMIAYPTFGVKFDVLLKWLKKYNHKSLQDQRANDSFGFETSMLGYESSYYWFSLNKTNHQFEIENFKREVLDCANKVFTNYATLPLAYKSEIEPILRGEKEMPDVGMDWAFKDLTLCKIVNPKCYEDLKKIILSRIEFMRGRNEPNVAIYYDRLDEILEYLEGLTIDELYSFR